MLNFLNKTVKLIKRKKLKISIAESCTGGLMASMITSISGSSKIFDVGFVTYSNKSKINILKFPKNVIKKYGSVSHQCCLFMLNNLMKITKTDVTVAITGIAGPKGGSLKKPVGLVFVGVKYKDKVLIKKFLFKKNKRIEIQKASAKEAFKLLLSKLS